MDDAIRINLLDWRQAARLRRRRNFLCALLLVTTTCVAFIALLTLYFYGQRIDRQHQRNNYLEQQISVEAHKVAALKTVKKKRAVVIRRLHTIADLQRSQAWVAYFLDQIVATIPDTVVLMSLVQSGNTTTLKGRAQSNAGISTYMARLGQSDHLKQPQLIVIKSGASKRHHGAGFTLRIRADYPGTQRRLAIATP